MIVDLQKDESTFERRQATEYRCTKMDTFSNINQSLTEIKCKLDDLSEEMRTMIKLEQQVLTQSKDIERLNKTIEHLKDSNQILSDRLLELRSNFESQKQSLGTVERVGWAVATCVAIVIGKQLGIS